MIKVLMCLKKCAKLGRKEGYENVEEIM